MQLQLNHPTFIHITCLSACVFFRLWGDTGGLPEHCSLLWGREETPAGWQVLSEVWAVQQSKSPLLLIQLFTYQCFSFYHLYESSFCPPSVSGPETLPEVSQRWRQLGSRDGYWDSESWLCQNEYPCAYTKWSRDTVVMFLTCVCVCVSTSGGSGQRQLSDKSADRLPDGRERWYAQGNQTIGCSF